MPDIIRLRTAGETTSGMNFHSPVSCGRVVDRNSDGTGECGFDPGSHGLRQELHDRHNDSVSELTIGLRVRDPDPKLSVASLKPHQPGTFERRQSARARAGLIDEDFRAILIISSGQRPGNVIRTKQAETKTIALGRMLRLVVLKIGPELGRKGIFGIHFRMFLKNGPQLWTRCGIRQL